MNEEGIKVSSRPILVLTCFFLNYLQTFKIQGQIHHRAGSLLPPPNEGHKFLQIYFVGDSATELDKCCEIFNATNRVIIAQLQNLLHEHNELVRLFKIALDTMYTDDHKIVTRADRRRSCKAIQCSDYK